MRTLLLAAALLIAQPALAHTDEVLDTMTAPHGGQLRMAGVYHYELVLHADRVDVHVLDHANQPQTAAGVTGTVTLLSGKTKQSLSLVPAGKSHLSAKGTFDTQAQTKAVVKLNFPKEGELTAMFELNKPKPSKAEKHEHAHEHGHEHRH